MKKRLTFLILVLGVFLVLTPTLFALDEFTHVISNSEDWRDVYSTLLFASLEDAGSDFLVSTAHGQVLLNGINKGNDILVVSSKKMPFVFNYPSIIETKGYNSVQEIEVNSANLELIDELPDVEGFVIVGDSYGYSAVSATPYAVLTHSWVFLANRANIGEIESILSRRSIKELIIYGYVDSEVTEALADYNPEIINSGDKFQDNIDLVEKYSEKGSIQQIILTNGEFLEKEIMDGNNPILFTGKENVPDQIAEYIKSSDISVGVLIGNDLIGAATNIKRTTGISVMVKFARGARENTAGIAAVEGLDLFYLPGPNLELEIYSIKYNKATSQLEVTYRSNSNIPAYFKGTFTLNSDSGTTRVGDLDPIFISPGDFKTVVYDGVDLSGEEITAEYFTIYGESEKSLDRILQGTYEVGIVSVLDECQLDVKYVKYNKQEKSFMIKIKNLGDVECWVNVELQDLLINNIEQTIGTEGSESVLPKKSKRIFIEQNMI